MAEKMDSSITIQRLQEEMDTLKDENRRLIGSVVIRYLAAHEEEADRLPTDKTISGCYDFLRQRAEQRKKGMVGVAGFDDVFDYFGLSGDSLQSEYSLRAVDTISGRRTASEPENQKSVIQAVEIPEPVANISIDDLFE